MSLSRQYLDLDTNMLYEIASGMEEPVLIARRYGFTPEQWFVLEHRKDVIAAVERIRAELAKNGTTFKNRARLMSEQLMDNMYKAALDVSVPVKDKASALQVLARLGELEPKGQQVQAQGSGFSIQINLPSGYVAQKEPEKAKVDDVVDVKESAQLSLEFPGDGKC